MTTETLDLAPYSEVKAAIAKMKSESAGLTFDYETPKGNKLARSHVASLRSVKGDIERKRKELKAEALEYGRKVDAVAKELTAEIEAMIERHQEPLDLIESREQARIARHQANLAALTLVPGYDIGLNSNGIRSLLARINDTVIDDKWEEFKTQALEAQAASCRMLETRLTQLLKSEAEAEELARLRREREEHEAKERAANAEAERLAREERIRAEAADRARREAEEAAMRAAREKEAETQRAIAAASMEAEKAKRAAAEAETRAAREAAERERAAKEEAEVKAKRAADAKHRAKVLGEALAALVRHGLDEANAKLALEAIAEGKVPHVKVEF